MRRLQKRLSARYYKRPPLRSLVPNAVTLISLCSGLTAVFEAVSGQWQKAVLFIFLSMILDGLDGRLARLLGVSSAFGAELDSLSDFMVFGVAPGFVMYFWTLNNLSHYGWVPVLLLAVCAAIRLARFNVAISEEQQSWKRGFFLGCPSPMGALLAIFPLVLWFAVSDLKVFGEMTVILDVLRLPLFAFVSVSASAFLMVSTIPMFSFKKLPSILNNFWSAIIFLAIFFVLVFVQIWAVAVFLSLTYLLLIPFSVMRYRTLSQQENLASRAD